MITKLNYPHIGIFILSWFVADLIIPILIQISPKLGAVDMPKGYKQHKEPVSFLGGLAISIAFLIALMSIFRFTSYHDNRPLFIILIAGFSIMILGLMDDFRPISAIFKFFFLILVTFLLYSFDIQIYLPFFKNSFSWMNFTISLLWITAITSAVNSLDHADGIASGVCAIASFFIFYIAWKSYNYYPGGEWHNTQRWISFISIALLGGCFGFLRYNFFSPAKIFLGDSGSLLLGFLLASMSILGHWSLNDPLRSFLIPCCILVVPLYDITLSTVLRYKNRIVKNPIHAITFCGQDHLTHRFIALGFSPQQARLVIYLIGVLGGATALFISNPMITRSQYLIICGVGIILLIVIGIVLDKTSEIVYEDKESLHY